MWYKTNDDLLINLGKIVYIDKDTSAVGDHYINFYLCDDKRLHEYFDNEEDRNVKFNELLAYIIDYEYR